MPSAGARKNPTKSSTALATAINLFLACPLTYTLETSGYRGGFCHTASVFTPASSAAASCTLTA